MLLLNKLCDVISEVDDDGFLFLGGDFNCTAEASLYRNYLEPHPASSARLKRLIETHDLKDVWRGLNGRRRRFPWSHCRDADWIIFTVLNITLVFLTADRLLQELSLITHWFIVLFLLKMLKPPAHIGTLILPF